MNTKVYTQWLQLAAVLILLFAALGLVSPVYAGTCVVTTAADSGAGSLRDKIADPTCDTITFAGDTTVALASTLTLDRDMTIDGAGHSVVVTRRSDIAVQLFAVNVDATVNLSNLTLTDGRKWEFGGGIYNMGTLSLTKVTVSDSWTEYAGGGIYNTGVLYVMASAFSGNVVDFGQGGAICNWGGTLYVENSTFSANWGIWGGGGIVNREGSTLYVTNSTFSDNTSTWGGGIRNDGTATVTNSTFTGNLYGGIASEGTATVMNTLLANNTQGNCINTAEGVLTVSNSLANDESCGSGFYSPSILLSPLADNGGPTLTVALLPGSAAIDTGDDALCPATDQRGVTRPQGVHCDIGAYEAEPVASENTAPVAQLGGPYLGAISTALSFDGSGSSDADGDALTYAWTFGDGGAGTGATPAHSYAAPGVYDVCLTVNDGTVDSNPACTLAVAYDPSAGFVTGGGWIDSPAGAYLPDPTLSGQATFGFVSKYNKAATVPTGTTQFQFTTAGLSFYSETYEWLVVNQSGTNAQFKGRGLINGAADPNGSAYTFMLWAGDGAASGGADTFRIRIWWEDAAGEHDVYDNGVAQAIGAGNIVVHTKK